MEYLQFLDLLCLADTIVASCYKSAPPAENTWSLVLKHTLPGFATHLDIIAAQTVPVQNEQLFFEKELKNYVSVATKNAVTNYKAPWTRTLAGSQQRGCLGKRDAYRMAFSIKTPMQNEDVWTKRLEARFLPARFDAALLPIFDIHIIA